MSEKTVSDVRVESDNDYVALENLIGQRVAEAEVPLFTTANADGLFETYLAVIPASFRQH
mgnify:CR=1 FL=1